MKKYSASQLGKRLGMSGADVNQELFKKGFLTGKPGAWKLTEKGKQYGEEKFYPRYKTHGASVGYDMITWVKEVAYKIGDPDGAMKIINKWRHPNHYISWDSDE